MDILRITLGSSNPPKNMSDPVNMILNIRRDMVVYHNHKENLAYLATVAYLTGVFAFISGDIYGLRKIIPDVYAQKLAIVFPFFVVIFIMWQFTKRWEASAMVDICTTLAARWLDIPPKSDELTPRCFKGGYLPKAFCDEAANQGLGKNMITQLFGIQWTAQIQLILLLMLAFYIAYKLWNSAI